MNETTLQALIDSYLSGGITPAELQQLNKLLEDPAVQQLVEERIYQQLSSGALRMDEDFASLNAGIAGRIRQSAPPRVRIMPRWAWAAASIVLLLGIGLYFITSHHQQAGSAAVAAHPADIAPGRNGAVLTLGDGTEVVLDSLQNGVVASQNGAKVVLQGGGIAYDPSGANVGEVLYNTMHTPKGRQFKVVLPDGTIVWLNAASSIRYPTVFTGKERKVEISGEALFEVAKNARMPFRVSVNGRAEIEVLGTSFNVNAYTNENRINATLLDGAIAVNAGQRVVLKPGQQAQVAGEIKVVNEADVDNVIAWKNGFFSFDGLTLGEVMRQIERWYDIKVEFKGANSNMVIGGKLDRNVNLQTVLEILKRMKVRYEWDGEKLTML